MDSGKIPRSWKISVTHITYKDIAWLVLLIIGFCMHWAAFQTRVLALEVILNGPPPMDNRVAKLEQAYLDIHELVKELHEKNFRDALHDR